MSKTSTRSLKLGRDGTSTPMIDSAIVPILAMVYVIIVSPLLGVVFPNAEADDSVISRLQSMMTPRPENKIFWPALVAISIVLAVRNRYRLVRLTLPPHIICLLAYLAFAGASVLWALRPEVSFTRFMLQVMIVTSIVLPGMLADRTVDMMRGVFLCFAFASILNVFFVLEQHPMLNGDGTIIGYPGYFSFKGLLGECAAITFLLSLHEMLYPGLRRVAGTIVAVIAISLIFPSYSKGSFGIAIIAPLLALLTLIVGRKMRISPAFVLLPLLLCYEVLSRIPGVDLVNRISWYLFGNYTLSGRTAIWDFVNEEIARRPLLGWGFQSFWQVGLDGPSIVDSPGWIGLLPSGHNGYLDVMLEIGYLGFPFLIIFIMATLHAIGRVADRNLVRAWLVLSLALFIIFTNMLESEWMRGQDMQWVLFLILVAEIGRYWDPFSPDSRSQHRRVLRSSVIAGQRPGIVPEHLTKRLNR
jgi:exopolysaccharide production protein ExoQ